MFLYFSLLCQAGWDLCDPEGAGTAFVTCLKLQRDHVHIAFALVSILEGLVFIPLSTQPSALNPGYTLFSPICCFHLCVWGTPSV